MEPESIDEEDVEVQIIWDDESQGYLLDDWILKQQTFFKYVREGYNPPVRPQEIQTTVVNEFGGEIPAGADISDWFNYGERYLGLNEKTLQDYINSQRQLRADALRKFHESQSNAVRTQNLSPDRVHKKSSSHKRDRKKHDHHKHSKRTS